MRQMLNFLEILAICIGSIMTTAIFAVPGILYEHAGYSSLFIWILAAAITVPMGLCYAELSGILPKSGGPFIYARKSFGDFPGFVTGWSMWLYSIAAIAMLAMITSRYVSGFIQMEWWGRVALSIGLLALFTGINIRGLKQGARVEMVMIVLAIAVYLLYIATGLPSVDMARFAAMVAGFNSALLIIALEPFIGWETPTVIADEVKNARRTLPKAIALTTLLTAVLNMLLVLVFLGNVEPSAKVSAMPLAAAAQNFAPGLAFAFALSIIVIGFSALNSWVLTVARVPAAMAQKRLFPLSFAKTNASGAPVNALLLQFAVASALCFITDLERVLEILLTVAFVMYIISFAALLKLRTTQEAAARPVKLPVIFPMVGIASAVALLLFVTPSALLIGAVMLASGIPAYVVVKLVTDRDFVEKFWDRTSFFWKWYWPRFLYRGPQLRKVLAMTGIRDGQTILDHGAGTGVTTIELSKRYPNSRIVADDISRKQLGHAVASYKKGMKLPNVIFVKAKRIAPYPPNSFDRMVCTVAINYFVNPQKELGSLYRVLKRGGRATFLAVHAPGLVMHPFLKSDSTIRMAFSNAGFGSITIKREKKALREYIYISADK